MKDKNMKRFVAEAEDGIFHSSEKPLTEEDRKKTTTIWKDIIEDSR